MIDLRLYSDYLFKKQAEKELIESSLKVVCEEVVAEGKELEDSGKAREIINVVLKISQEAVKMFIESIVSRALSIVYGDDYGFKIDYVLKRNQSEAILHVLKNGDEFSLREEVGGGINDIVSFALRIALWSMLSPRTSRVFLLDEPAKFLSRDKQESFGRMLSEISKMLGLQIILVSHSNEIIGSADSVFEVFQEKGISTVKEI